MAPADSPAVTAADVDRIVTAAEEWARSARVRRIIARLDALRPCCGMPTVRADWREQCAADDGAHPPHCAGAD